MLNLGAAQPVPGAPFASVWSEQPGDWLPVGTSVEPLHGFPPQPGGGPWLWDRPNFVSGCLGKDFSQLLVEAGERASVAGGPGMPSGELTSARATGWARGAAAGLGSAAQFHCAPSALAAEVKRNYFSHLGHTLGEQIPPQLHLSCQSDLAPLAEG